MCPSKLNLQPQQPKCLTQYLPAFLGSSWEAPWHVPASSALPGIPSLHIPALLLRALQLQHLHQSPSLGEPLRHCCSTWGCPCPRSLLQDLQPLQTAGQHKCTEERTRITLGFPQSQPHPAAGHGSTHHRNPCTSSSFLLLTLLAWMCLAWCSQRASQGKWFQSWQGNLCIPEG